MKECWELECAYYATQRFRMILQTAKQKQFHHFGKLSVLQIWAALWLWPHVCGASDPPRHWGELYKRSPVQFSSNPPEDSPPYQVRFCLSLLSPFIFYFIICKLCYWQVLGSRPGLGALSSVILILLFPSCEQIRKYQMAEASKCKILLQHVS